MATTLPKFTLDHDKAKGDWRLTNDATNRIVKRFELKDDAIKGGVLNNAVGVGGGSVKMKKVDNLHQEERTYSGTADPKKSQGQAGLLATPRRWGRSSPGSLRACRTLRACFPRRSWTAWNDLTRR